MAMESRASSYVISLVGRGEIQVHHTGAKQRQSATFSFDNVVEMPMRPRRGSNSSHNGIEAMRGETPLRTSSGLSTESLSSSQLLYWAAAGYIVGYNSAVVMQETLAAQQEGGCEAMIHHTLSNCIANSPDEAAFFLSASYLDFTSTVDLLSSAAVRRASVKGSTDASRSSPQVGQSPLTGIFLSSAELKHIVDKEQLTATLNTAFGADAAIIAAGAPPHFLVVSFWQKLYVASENDVCISSFLFIITRNGPGVMAEALSRSATEPCGQLLNYALCGACYTICGCSMTDDERWPSDSTLNYRDELLTSLSFYQGTLNACTGRSLRYNSVTDAVKQHQHDMEQTIEGLEQLKLKVRTKGEYTLTGAERHSQVVLSQRARQLDVMIRDEERLIRHGIRNLSAVPPFYIVE